MEGIVVLPVAFVAGMLTYSVLWIVVGSIILITMNTVWCVLKFRHPHLPYWDAMQAIRNGYVIGWADVINNCLKLFALCVGVATFFLVSVTVVPY